MATSTEVRTWARGNGETLTDRGRIPARIVQGWNDAHADDPYMAEDRRAVPGAVPDYPDDDFESAFAVMPADPGTDPHGDEAMTEKQPRRPAKKAAATRAGWFGRRKHGPKKRLPRVSTDGIWGAVWRGVAGIATPLPPLQRTLRIQAPVAGVIIDGIVKDTVIDPLLQPLARLAGAGKAASALVGPPVFVTAITVYGQSCAARGELPNPIVWQGLDEGLTQSLAAWFEVAGPEFEKALQREKDFEERHGKTIQAMKEFLFSPPPATDAERAEEEDAIRRAQGMADAA